MKSASSAIFSELLRKVRLTRRDVEMQADNGDSEPVGYYRPSTRGECLQLPRPCPYVGCRYHLLLDVKKGAIKVRVPPDDMQDTCALDVADRGPHSLFEIADLVSVTRENIRQIEAHALSKLRRFVKHLGESDATSGRGIHTPLAPTYLHGCGKMPPDTPE